MKKYDKVVAADGTVTVLNTEKEFLTHHAELKEMVEFVESLDPLNGRNVMRYAAQAFTDNGDGTMTMRRPLPYSTIKTEGEKPVDIMDETRKMLR